MSQSGLLLPAIGRLHLPKWCPFRRQAAMHPSPCNPSSAPFGNAAAHSSSTSTVSRHQPCTSDTTALAAGGPDHVADAAPRGFPRPPAITQIKGNLPSARMERGACTQSSTLDHIFNIIQYPSTLYPFIPFICSCVCLRGEGSGCTG